MKKLRSYLVKITWLPGSDTGWGNGYVILPKEHSMHGVNYGRIPVDIHGGLTFSNYGKNLPDVIRRLNNIQDDDYIVGFDTAHLNDDLIKWSQEAVQRETDNLTKQLKKL